MIGETSNPNLKNCEIYDHLSCGIWVKEQAGGTYTNCYIHNNEEQNFCNDSSNFVDTSTCRMD